MQQAEARCDFAPNKVRISYRNPAFGIISLWKKSLYGRTLTDIKSDPDMAEKLAETEEDLLEHRTDGTDAFDTLYIGCEKFPYHDTFAVNISGIS